MKKLFAILSLGAILLPGMVSCSKDNAAATRDDLGRLLSKFCIIRENEAEKTTTAFITMGRRLNEADPTELSVKAESYEAAAALFDGMIPEDADVTRSDGSVIWHLKGANGVSQGDAVFQRGSGSQVAVLTLPSSSIFVKKVCFIPPSAWPENIDWDREELLDELYFGRVIDVKKDESKKPGSYFCKGDCGTGKFIVVKEYNPDTDASGILLRLEPDKIRRSHSRFNWASDIAVLKDEMTEIYEIYKKRKNVLDPIMTSCGFGPRDAKYLISNEKDVLFNWGDNGKVSEVSGEFYIACRYYFQFIYCKVTYDWNTGKISDSETFEAKDFVVLQGDMVTLVNVP